MTPPVSYELCHDLGRAVLARRLAGEFACLERVPANTFAAPLSQCWSTASKYPGLSAAELALQMRNEGIDVVVISQLAGADEHLLISSAQAGVHRILEALSRREAAGLAESYAQQVQAGGGDAEWDELRSARERLQMARGDLPAPMDLSDWRAAVAPPFVVPGLIPANALTFVSASGGVGKSLLLLWILAKLAVGSPETLLGVFPLTGRPVRVLILDAENGAPRILHRLRCLVQGGGLTSTEMDRAKDNLIVYPREHLFDKQSVIRSGQLEQLIKRDQVGVVFIDPMRPFYPATMEDENSAVEIGRTIDALGDLAARLGVAIVVADHDNRAGQALRGASAKRDAAAYVVHLTQPEKNDPDELELRLDKDRDPRLISGVAIRRVRGPDSVRFEASERRVGKGSPGKRGGDNLSSRCQEILEENPGVCFTAARMASAIGQGARPETVQKYLRGLAKAGVCQTERGSATQPFTYWTGQRRDRVAYAQQEELSGAA